MSFALARLVVLAPVFIGSPEGPEDDLIALFEAVREIHPAPYRVNDVERWEEEMGLFAERMPELAEHERMLGFARILALVGDGHTELAGSHPSLDGAWLPLAIRRFADGWFLRTGHRRYAALFGKRIIEVAGVPIEEAATLVRPFVSADNAMGTLDPIGNMLRHPAVLHAAGVTDARLERVEIAAEDVATGEVVRIEVEANDERWVTPDWVDADAVLSDGPKPLYRRLDGNYDFEYLEDENTVFVLFDSVRDDDGETIEAFFGRVFEFVRENEVDRFVLDIRENGGGNNYLNYPILHGLIPSQVNRPGHLFVVIGRDTYSAAMCLAVALERHTHAIFVGEPTGATPNHYGDTREVTLPHSGLVVEISELYWQNSDPRDERPWITPDLPVTLTARDFFENRDPALEAIFAYEHDPTATVPPTATRWYRAGQLQEQTWPGLLQRN